MRFLTILPLLVIGTSSYLVARARNAPRNVQFRASVEGNVLAVRGELQSASAPWLASDVRLYSTARDGTLGIVRVAAFDANGRATRAWQTSVESSASTVVVASNAKSLEIDVSLDALVSGNTSMGYASEDGTAIALPIRRFLFGAGGRSRWSVHSEANDLLGPEWLDRGLY